jgi:hypothetical protein
LLSINSVLEQALIINTKHKNTKIMKDLNSFLLSIKNFICRDLKNTE